MDPFAHRYLSLFVDATILDRKLLSREKPETKSPLKPRKTDFPSRGAARSFHYSNFPPRAQFVRNRSRAAIGPAITGTTAAAVGEGGGARPAQRSPSVGWTWLWRQMSVSRGSVTVGRRHRRGRQSRLSGGRRGCF